MTGQWAVIPHQPQNVPIAYFSGGRLQVFTHPAINKEDFMLFVDDHGLPAHSNEVSREAMAWLDRYVGPGK
jgi:hypothetical protein